MTEETTAFNVPDSIANIEAVPEKFRGLYVEKNGAYVFQDPAVIARSMEHAKRERDDARKKASSISKWERLGKTPEEVEELLRATEEAEAKKAEEAGDFTKVLKQHQDKWEKSRSELEAELNAARASEREAIITNSLMSSLSKNGVTEEGIDLLPDRLAARIQFKLQDGRRVITVTQPDGQTPMIGGGPNGEATYDDLVKEAMSKWPSLFKGSGVSGSGATPSNSVGGAGKKITKADLKATDAATRKARATFVDTYGLEAYNALPDK